MTAWPSSRVRRRRLECCGSLKGERALGLKSAGVRRLPSRNSTQPTQSAPPSTSIGHTSSLRMYASPCTWVSIPQSRQYFHSAGSILGRARRVEQRQLGAHVPSY
jgi:hypothetical protein